MLSLKHLIDLIKPSLTPKSSPPIRMNQATIESRTFKLFKSNLYAVNRLCFDYETTIAVDGNGKRN